MLIRAFIVALLILNVGVAVWWLARPDGSQGGPDQAAAPANSSGAGVPRLVLVDGSGPDVTSPEAGGPEAARAADAIERSGSSGSTGAPASDAVLPTPDLCVSHGPFATAEAAAAAQRRARRAGATAGVRAQAAAPYRGWKVWLPPFETLEQAEQMAARVAAAGFADQFIARDGPDAGSLALGRFASEAPARQHAEKLVAAGFPARAEPIGSGTVGYWLDVAGSRSDASRLRDQIAAPQALQVDCATWR